MYPPFKAVTESACAEKLVFDKYFTTLSWGLTCETILPNDVLIKKRTCRDFGQNQHKL